MNSVIEKLEEIERAAEAIVEHAQDRKSEIEKELQEKRDRFDQETEARTQEKLAKLRKEREEKMTELLAEQREKNSQRVLNLEKEFEEYHTVYAEEILKSIIEV